MPQDYVYDIFVSYRRKPAVMNWMKYHFFPLLDQRLPDYMPIAHEPKIFIDWHIETGSTYPTKLYQSLKTSRCLLAVWSPEYFRSKWCLAELYTMLERERLIGLRSDSDPSGLIYPVTFAGGKHLPPVVENIQSKDLSKWNSQYKSFSQTAAIVEFDQEVQLLCDELWKMIQRAPAWQDWPVITPEIVGDITVKQPRL